MVTSGDASVEAEFSLFVLLVEAKLNETNRNIAYEKEKKGKQVLRRASDGRSELKWTAKVICRVAWCL